MINSRIGKIARLPAGIREKLNFGIRDGMKGRALVDWLNTLPEVHAMLEREFDGKPIREQNLSEWRSGGYKEWLAQHEALAAVFRVNAETLEIDQYNTRELTDSAAVWLTSRYLVAIQEMMNKEGGPDWKMLRECCSDIVALRRGDHSRARIRIEARQQSVEEEVARATFNRGVKFGLRALRDFCQSKPEKAKAFNEFISLIMPEIEKQDDGEKSADHPIFAEDYSPI